MESPTRADSLQMGWEVIPIMAVALNNQKYQDVLYVLLTDLEDGKDPSLCCAAVWRNPKQKNWTHLIVRAYQTDALKTSSLTG